MTLPPVANMHAAGAPGDSVGNPRPLRLLLRPLARHEADLRGRRSEGTSLDDGL
jgi:hypothetical protein